MLCNFPLILLPAFLSLLPTPAGCSPSYRSSPPHKQQPEVRVCGWDTFIPVYPADVALAGTWGAVRCVYRIRLGMRLGYFCDRSGMSLCSKIISKVLSSLMSDVSVRWGSVRRPQQRAPCRTPHAAVSLSLILELCALVSVRARVTLSMLW